MKHAFEIGQLVGTGNLIGIVVVVDAMMGNAVVYWPDIGRTYSCSIEQLEKWRLP